MPPDSQDRWPTATSRIQNVGGIAAKTTLLAALLGRVPASERIVTIEDVAELRISHPHHVRLEARQPNLEGAGAVPLARLVREALRMRPDRLVVGECRGEEVRELLMAQAVGSSSLPCSAPRIGARPATVSVPHSMRHNR